MVKKADYSIIIRDNNLVTRAGFPTKFVESVACGTPVICNDNSDLKEWIDRCGCGFVVDKRELGKELARVLSDKKPDVDQGLFDYHRFCEDAKRFFESMS